MAVYLEIVDVYAREILDSRGNPTVETEVKVKDGNHILPGGQVSHPASALGNMRRRNCGIRIRDGIMEKVCIRRWSMSTTGSKRCCLEKMQRIRF